VDLADKSFNGSHTGLCLNDYPLAGVGYCTKDIKLVSQTIHKGAETNALDSAPDVDFL
jgi:hypothetical protein